MLLWREMCPAPKVVDEEDGEKRDWDSWGRPRGGFIDLGCVRALDKQSVSQLTPSQGNGLLVHILIVEVDRRSHSRPRQI